MSKYNQLEFKKHLSTLKEPFHISLFVETQFDLAYLNTGPGLLIKTLFNYLSTLHKKGNPIITNIDDEFRFSSNPSNVPFTSIIKDSIPVDENTSFHSFLGKLSLDKKVTIIQSYPSDITSKIPISCFNLITLHTAPYYILPSSYPHKITHRLHLNFNNEYSKSFLTNLFTITNHIELMNPQFFYFQKL